MLLELMRANVGTAVWLGALSWWSQNLLHPSHPHLLEVFPFASDALLQGGQDITVGL